MKTDCGRELEILEALTSGRWPDACSPELREHAAACGGCADLVEVVPALVGEHADAARLAPVPSGAIVWWRAQMRARRDADRAVSRPITVVQGMTLAATVALSGATAGAAVAFFRGALPTLDELMRYARTLVPPLEMLTTPLGLAFAMLVAVWLVGAPLAVYLAASDD